jgi:HAD superfamily hydrolase (TIGR01509 family)
MTLLRRSEKLSQPVKPDTVRDSEALVFDFDGVIADTEPMYWRAWHELLKEYDLPFAWADYCRIGRGIRDEAMLVSLAAMLPNAEVMTRIRKKIPECAEKVRRWMRDKPPISDATVQLLKSLEGRALGLVTTSNRSDVEELLYRKGIDGCFKACVYGEEVTRHKPDPAPYLLIREKLGVRGGIVFEDSEVGLLSAAKAGFQCIRVSTPGDLPKLVSNALGLASSQ